MTSENEPLERDDLVSETYRELGTETVPEHLNQRILRTASDGGKQSPARGILFAAWLKPAAWAATIALSLAIVLESSQVPTVPVLSDDVPATESMREEAFVEEVLLIDSVAIEKVENRARAESARIRQRVSADELKRSATTHDEVEAFSREPEALSREPKDKLDSVAAPQQSGQPPSPSPTTAATSAEAERAADLPAASERVADRPEKSKRGIDIPANKQPMASFSLMSEQSDTDDFCDATTRVSEEGWLACIENLRRSGNEEAADREFEAFILKYSVESPNLEGNK